MEFTYYFRLNAITAILAQVFCKLTEIEPPARAVKLDHFHRIRYRYFVEVQLI